MVFEDDFEDWAPSVLRRLQQLKDEQWKEVKGFENYEVSAEGEVMNTNTSRVLKTYHDKSGYETVVLYKNGKSKSFYVHQLVAEAFLNKRDKSLNRVIHINGIKTDNRLENLRWMMRNDIE